MGSSKLATPVRAVLWKAVAVQSEQQNFLLADRLTPTEKKIYAPFRAEELPPMDDLLETSGLNSSEVLATLFSLERKEIVWQLPGAQFNKVRL